MTPHTDLEASDPVRCGARTRDGATCRSFPMKGGNRCRMHGGSSPNARRAAERRLQERAAKLEAAELVDRTGTDAHPIEHLLDGLTRAAALVDVLARRLEGEELVEREGLHPLWPPFERERDRHARIAKACLDAGVDERRVRLGEQQAEVIADAVTGALTELGHDVTDVYVRQTIAKHLRAAGEDEQ